MVRFLVKSGLIISLALGLLIFVGGNKATSQTIVVDTLTDWADPPFDGDGGSGGGTIADLPGADGKISLREAIIAANNTAGSQTITFDPSLSGGTIAINFDDLDSDSDPDELPYIWGGGTTIDGDIDGDGNPDITLDGAAGTSPYADNGIVIYSSDNIIKGLRLTNFTAWAIIIGTTTGAPTISNNTISQNIVTDGGFGLIVVGNVVDSVITNTTISNNTFSNLVDFGILVASGDDGNSRISGVNISDNNVSHIIPGNYDFGTGIDIATSNAGIGDTITGVNIVNNTVSNCSSIGIVLIAGGDNSTLTDVTLSDNTSLNNRWGIYMLTFGYGNGNTLSSVMLTNNDISGNEYEGLLLIGGYTTNYNAISDISIENNNINNNGFPGIAIIGSISLEGTYSPHNNSVTNISIKGNNITSNSIAGIGLAGGEGESDTLTGISVESNTIADTLLGTTSGGIEVGVGILLTGGGSYGGTNESVSNVAIYDNTIRNNAEDGIWMLDTISSGSGNSVEASIYTNIITGHPDRGIGLDIYAGGTVNATIYNNTIAGNSIGISNSGATATIFNTILWNNTDDLAGISSSDISYSDIGDGEFCGANGNICTDPVFRDLPNGDIHLLPGSPCIDTGTNAGAPSDDFEGTTIPLDGDGDGVALVDIGADEYDPALYPDLTIYSSDISFDPPGPSDPGTQVTITANIHNEGGTYATCDVSFYYDDSIYMDSFTDLPVAADSSPNIHLIDTVTDLPVAADSSANAQVVWDTTGLEPRKYPVIVVISNANPAESDTSNNQAQADYTLPVELASFEARAGDGEILLSWVSESETDNYGWNIYRATDPEGIFNRVNIQVIPGAGTSPVAHFYSYRDQGLTNGTTYYYYLEAIRLDGEGEESFMVSATPAAGNSALNSQPFKEEEKSVTLIPKPVPYPGELEGLQYFPIPQAKILVDQRGSYRITYSDLAAAGIEVSEIDTQDLTLSNKGKLVPLVISDGGDGRLDSGDYLEFAGSFNPGTYTYEDIYSRVNVYWLSWWPKEEAWQETSPRATNDEGLPNKDLSRESKGVRRETIHLEEDNIFSRLGHARDGKRDHWFWAQVDAPGSFDAPFILADYKPLSETIRIKVRLQGNSHLAIEPDHYAQLFLNDRFLGEVRWDGQEDYLLEKEIPVSYLSEGKNTLKVVLPGLEGLPKSSRGIENSPFGHEAIDSIFLDWLEISYLRGASPERLKFPLKPRAIVPDFPSDLRNPNNGADYIIITHSDFSESALRLARFREQGGLRTKVVDITDIYDEFSYGIFNPEAIKSFLQYAYRHWQKPGPSYVLLLGDASEDYKDNSHTGSRNYVPSYPYFSPGFGQTISDHWFACLEGKDVVPEISIGRLPARTPEEAEVMVEKIINYGASTGSGRVLFINGGYDIGDEEFFDDSSEYLIQRYLGNGFQATRVYGQPSRPDLLGYQGGREEIIEAINAGVGIVNFLGHAASRTWDIMFSKEDIAWLHNSTSLPFILSMTCHTGHFATTPGSDQGQGFRIVKPVHLQSFPGQIVMLDDGDSFAEAFLKKRDGGAIAFLGNTAMGLLYGDSYLDEALFRAIFTEGITTLGPAIDEAKRMVLKNHPGYQHLIATFVLLGDPALELR